MRRITIKLLRWGLLKNNAAMEPYNLMLDLFVTSLGPTFGAQHGGSDGGGDGSSIKNNNGDLNLTSSMLPTMDRFSGNPKDGYRFLENFKLVS